MTDVFISYSSPDKKVAQDIAEQLEGHGYSVFLDFDVLVPGESFSTNIANEIENANVVIVLLSKNTQRSKWVQDELAFALEKGRPERVIPVLLDSKGKENWVWPLVADRKPVELVSIEDGLSQLLSQVSLIVPKSYKSEKNAVSHKLKKTIAAPKRSTWLVSALLWSTIGAGALLVFSWFMYQEALQTSKNASPIEPKHAVAEKSVNVARAIQYANRMAELHVHIEKADAALQLALSSAKPPTFDVTCAQPWKGTNNDAIEKIRLVRSDASGIFNSYFQLNEKWKNIASMKEVDGLLNETETFEDELVELRRDISDASILASKPIVRPSCGGSLQSNQVVVKALSEAEFAVSASTSELKVERSNGT